MKANRNYCTWIACIGLALLMGSTTFGARKTKVDTPTINCGNSAQSYIEIVVCAPNGANATGAPAGFSIQWMTVEEYTANGGWYASDDPRLCKASFSGNAFNSRYNLIPGQCVAVRIGDLLLDNGASTNCPDSLPCGTDYVFRAFAHATNTLNRSDFTANLTCSTDPCNGQTCVHTQGYWKTHGPGGCANGMNEDAWPTHTLTLGNCVYTDDPDTGTNQICTILQQPAGGQNAWLALAHQLIAAKFNVLNGADDSCVSAYITAADALLATTECFPVGTVSIQDAGGLIEALTAFNEGSVTACPQHCGDAEL